MSNTDDYNSKLEQIKAITDEATLYPYMPVDIFLQEAETLYHWALDDLPELQKAGMTVELINDLQVRAGACREAQALWQNSRNTKEEAERKWKEESPVAYNLRDELLHSFRYAFRKKDDLLAVVGKIAEGDGHADMIQDLNDLAILGKANKELLQQINFDLNKLELAGKTSDEMANLLGIVNGDRINKDERLIIRDKAYTFLKEAVDEIRECGKYVFWKKTDRLKGYKSAYLSKINKKNRSNEE